MPTDNIGQQITFAVDQTADETFSKYVWVKAQRNDTIIKIAARRGHPEQATIILNLNRSLTGIRHTRLRSIHQTLREGSNVRLPGTLAPGDVVNILADDPPPIVKAGYATYDIVNVPGRRGVSRFLGFDPVALDVPIQWDAWAFGDGTGIEAEIATLQRMAGIGTTAAGGGLGARIGPPAVIRVSVTDNYGNIVPLIPAPFQWLPGKSAPEYRITNITWDKSPLRTGNVGRKPGGYRLRQKAVVEITEYTPINVAERSATIRARKRNTQAKIREKKG